VFGGLVGITQVSNAESAPAPAPTCEPTSPPAAAGTSSPDGTGGDADPTPGATPTSGVDCAEQDGGGQPSPTPGTPGPGGGLNALGDDCDDSKLPAHTGFQDGGRCVSTAFGEVGAADQNPTLLIAQAPRTVRAGQPFRLVVSTRNLVRDRFLPAGRGGYYLETSLLNDEGLVRGHFHTACRMLTSTSEAADPAPVPAFFVATEDGKGGEEPDSVIVEVPGLPTAGLAQCSSWAGDGSHRIPMMVRANQIPALDSVRILVQDAPEQPPANQPGDEEPPANQPPANEPGGQEPPANQPPANQPPANQPPANQPPANQPGGNEPPADQPGDEEPPAGNPGGQQPPANQPGNQSPGPKPDDDNPPGNGQESGEQPGKATTRPTPVATKPAPEKSAENANVVAEPPARDTGAGGSGGGLALTGANTIAFAGIGVALFVGGAALIFLTRRRRTARR